MIGAVKDLMREFNSVIVVKDEKEAYSIVNSFTEYDNKDENKLIVCNQKIEDKIKLGEKDKVIDSIKMEDLKGIDTIVDFEINNPEIVLAGAISGHKVISIVENKNVEDGMNNFIRKYGNLADTDTINEVNVDLMIRVIIEKNAIYTMVKDSKGKRILYRLFNKKDGVWKKDRDIPQEMMNLMIGK